MMFDLLRDQFTTFRLRARYRRLIQEQLLELTENRGYQPVSDEPGNWQLLGTGKGETPSGRNSIRDRARRLARENPHACNLLRLLSAYVTGPGLKAQHVERIPEDGDDRELIARANELWAEFLCANCRSYSFREHALRTWRDGECFLRKFSSGSWPPAIRFVDPEWISATPEAPDSQGILTADQDVEQPIAYLKHHPGSPDSLERIPAEEMLHTRTGVDSNEKRGVSIFAPILDVLDCYGKWLETELLARKLQSSIVLWRRIQGSPQMADAFADNAGRGGRQERFAPGSIVTTNQGTDIQFLQPQTNFSDAVPLGRMLLLSVAAGAGLPEFMLTADASNGNFASTMIAEGPAVKFFQSEQQFFAQEFTRIWRWVMEEAVAAGLLPEDFSIRVEVHWSFPALVNRDRAKERLADVRLIETGVLSRAEVARRDGVDPAAMRAERAHES